MIDVFKDTYNALYLKGLSSQKLNQLKSTLNPVQKRLIDNLQKKRSYDVKYIEGPIGIRKYKLVLNGKPKKSIYLFGERHFNTKGQCAPHKSIEFVEYIKRLSNDSPAFFDIYVETPILTSTISKTKSMNIFINAVKAMYRKRIKFTTAYTRYKLNIKNSTSTTGYMFKELRKEFKECIEPAKRINNSNCELFRFHFVDIRSAWDNPKDMNICGEKGIYNEDIALHMIYNVFISGLKAGKNADEIMDVLRRINKRCPSILNMLKMLISPTGELNLLDIFSKNKFFKNELDRSYKKEEIKSFLKLMSAKKIEVSSFTRDEFNQGIKDLIISIENKAEMNMEFIKKTKKLFLKLNDLLLDTYCLARIFKIHDTGDSFQPTESKNIIIYVGDAHARNIAEFLGYIGFKPTFSFYNVEEKSCVNMKEPNEYMPLRSPIILNQGSPKGSPKEEDLNKLKVNELKKIAKQLRCKGYSKLLKVELIQLIRRKQIPSPYSPYKEIKRLTVVQLKKLAKNLKVKGYYKMKKDELIKKVTI